MKKLNEYQAMIINAGLTMYAEALKKEIAQAEAAGKRPLMTQGFVDMQVTDTIDAIKALTTKSK